MRGVDFNPLGLVFCDRPCWKAPDQQQADNYKADLRTKFHGRLHDKQTTLTKC